MLYSKSGVTERQQSDRPGGCSWPKIQTEIYGVTVALWLTATASFLDTTRRDTENDTENRHFWKIHSISVSVVLVHAETENGHKRIVRKSPESVIHAK